MDKNRLPSTRAPWGSIGRTFASASRSLVCQCEDVSGRAHRVNVAMEQAKPIALQMIAQDFGSLNMP